MKKQILIVENNLVNCQAIQDYMENKGISVCLAKSVADAADLVLEQEYCLAIISIQPSITSDIEMLRMIRHTKKMPIIVLADQLTPSDRITLFQVGATVCAESSINLAVCTAQANSLIRLYLEAKEENRACLPLIFGTELMIDTAYRQVIIDSEPLDLTRKEFELFVCLAKHPYQIWSLTQLYRYVWNDTLGFDGGNTVKTHIGNLKKKLAHKGKNYIQNSRGVGYKFVPPACEDKFHKS